MAYKLGYYIVPTIKFKDDGNIDIRLKEIFLADGDEETIERHVATDSEYYDLLLCSTKAEAKEILSEIRELLERYIEQKASQINRETFS